MPRSGYAVNAAAQDVRQPARSPRQKKPAEAGFGL